MGSVQYFGEKCPVCGHNDLSYEYYYKTCEESYFCLCCGYAKNVHWKRDADRKLDRRLTQTIDLRKSLVYIGTADQVSDNGKVTQLGSPVRVTSDMTQEVLNKALHDNYDSDIFLQLPEEYRRLATSLYVQFIVEKGQLSVLEPEMIVEEKGGYGLLCLESGSCTALYSLTEDSTIESILSSMEEGDKSKIKALVIFSPRGENPIFYNTTPEEWFAQCES